MEEEEEDGVEWIMTWWRYCLKLAYEWMKPPRKEEEVVGEVW